MRLSQDIGIYDVENPIIKESTFPELGSSIITEPNIIPINNAGNSPNLNNNINIGNGSSSSVPIQVVTPVDAGNTSAGSTSGATSNNTSEPSATTDETKTYVGGGTTPDSNIVVKKPMTKYYVYGIIGLIGALVVYKTFFNKKPS
jgi:hypothetical protein